MNQAYIHKEEQKSKRIGYAVTLTFHALLLALLWWKALHIPDPPLGYGGMELSMALGEFDMGGPNEIAVDQPATEPIPEPVQDESELVTQEVEETPVTAPKAEEKKPEIKKPKEKPIENPIEKPRTADERSLFKKKAVAGNTGGSGDGVIPGNEGNPNGILGGSPDGNGIGDGQGGSGGGVGMGNGDGIGGFDLRGRSLSVRPDVTDNSKETGKVVVGITVDRSGHVIKVQPGIIGTTNLSPILLEKAKRGAMDARFSPKPDGQEEQYGTMTFVFRFKQ